MEITTQQKALIKESWGYLLRHGSLISDQFYPRLFQALPAAEALFHHGSTDQARKLRSVITLMVTKLDKLDRIEQEMFYLSKKHVGYHVQPAYFATFSRVLINTFADALGEKFTTAHREAWAIMLQIVSNKMIGVMQGHVKKETT